MRSSINCHKGMELKQIWFKSGEFKRLTDSLEGNFNDDVLDIMHEIYRRGDLK